MKPQGKKTGSSLCPGADSAALRILAAKQPNPRIAKRLRLIAHLADGLGILDAAARERVSETSAREWLALYRKGGVPALMRAPAGRRAWLTQEQSTALAAIIRENPEISYAELCAVAKRRFNVTYGEPGMAAYVTRQFGFMRHAGRFWGLGDGLI